MPRAMACRLTSPNAPLPSDLTMLYLDPGLVPGMGSSVDGLLGGLATRSAPRRRWYQASDVL